MKYPSAGLLAALAYSTNTLAAVLRTDLVPNAAEFVRAAQANGQKSTEFQSAAEGGTYDGVPLASIPQNIVAQGRAAVAPNAARIAPTGWTATADNWQPGNEPEKAIDGDANTFWHTQWGDDGKPPPHFLTVDMKRNYLINSIAMQPRQDGLPNGFIGQHKIDTSTDGTNWSPAKVIGTWRDDKSTKTSIFEATTARYVRLTAYTEAGGRGPWSSVAEFSIYETNTPAPPFQGIAGGSWSPTIDFPIVPVAAAVLYNSGNVLTWSSYAADTFGGSAGQKTVTSTYIPGSQTVTQRIVTNTQHDMFCPGLSINARGNVLVTGGDNAEKTSFYTPGTDAWSNGGNLKISAGYQSQTTLSDGRTFLIGGSWSGGNGNKNGQTFSITANAWSLLPNAPVAPMLTNDAQGVYRADNHAMLFGWKGGWVFQAGPSKRMNWYNANGAGGTNFAGTRGNDGDAMCGIAAMYDAVAGKILVTGGSPNYQNSDSTSNAQIITIGNSGAAVQTQTINTMWFQRIFANSVIMPNGNVLIVGGQVYGQPFSDATAQLTPEIWVAATTRFIKIPNINVPRVYHSVALLLADGTIFAGGGGLCGGCNTNHFDAQVYSPGYLFNGDGSRAARPTINSATSPVNPGQTLTVTGSTGITSWSLIRIASTTHTVNTDQRRIPLTANANGGTYTMTIPNDYGVVLPGWYYLFGMNAQGTPSIAKYVQIPR